MGLDMRLICPDGYEIEWSKQAHMVHDWFRERIIHEGKNLYDPYEGEECEFTGREPLPLAELCRHVLEEPEEAPSLMPTTYVYDSEERRLMARTLQEQRQEPERYLYRRGYFDEIRRTLEFLEWALGHYAPDATFLYWTSW